VQITPGDAASAVGALYVIPTTTLLSFRCAGTPEAGDVYTVYYNVRGS
jgi:hypothetical protein